jgi:hypothetical protein
MRTVIVLAVCALFFKGAMAQQRPEPIEKPAVKVGDTWIYNTLNGQTGVLEHVSLNVIRKIDEKAILIESSNLDGSSVSKILRTPDFNFVRLEAPTFTRTASPYYPNYAFPLRIGKTWKSAVVLENSNQPGKQVRAELEAKVIGWESVTVPAGNFLALKIELDGWYQGTSIEGNWTGRIVEALWYAPAVRNAVRYEYRDTVDVSNYSHEVHELVRYWLAP